MGKKLLAWALIGGLGALAALLALRAGPSRESLLPVMRVFQQHVKEADRAVAAVAPLSPEDERRIGEELSSALGARAAPPAVLSIGLELSGLPPVKRFRGRYEFRLCDSPEVNAFALPGGIIYVTQGLVDRFSKADPDAMAFVLGHEMGHVELGHAADAFAASEWLRRAGLGEFSGAPEILHALAQLQFSEVQELEADQYGVLLLASAGRDPKAALTAMDLLGLTAARDSSVKRGPGEVAGEALTDFLRTHPGSWERRARLEQEAAQLSAAMSPARAPVTAAPR